MTRTSKARAPRTRAALYTAALSLAIATQACAPDEASFYIAQAKVPQPGGAGGLCMTVPDRASPSQNDGILDVGLRSSYTIFPLYENQLITSSEPTRPAIDTRSVFVMGADIELRRGGVDGPLVALPGGVSSTYTVSTSTFVPSSTGSAPGASVGSLEIVPANVAAALRSRVCVVEAMPPGCNRPPVRSVPESVVAVVRPFGRTQGGIDMVGNFFTFPINVCCGCLIAFPPDSVNRDVRGANCAGGSAPTDATCSLGQDIAVDCRRCVGTNPLCAPLACDP